MKIEVRKADNNDSPAIASLSVQLGYNSNTEEIASRIKPILTLSDHCVFVAEINNNVVGWIHASYCLRVESASFVEVMGFVVDQSFRNKGIGKKLIAEVEDWLHFFDCKKLRVRCNIIRKESHIFYNRIGFKEIKEQKIFERSIK